MSWAEGILCEGRSRDRVDQREEFPVVTGGFRVKELLTDFRRRFLMHVTGGRFGTLPTPEQLRREFECRRVVSLPNVPDLASRLTSD
ncbi:MAG: hypothetical protein UU73_C0002G0031 [Candidatus Daviesbacteria bacterium GW2011_GWA1_41_61]|uniref:Uncharacterized protein n=1 Tax=Candidatus Daviesbacteria bacterium GW2011_GWA2_40_9 TaxID=1618424 RepID=A0A0G0U3T5_9BACT|nr:MAG: hypothetical protein UU26_C0008G0002 [Candidatus Daviesbacteria bacterium GW2011_GWC1_40_9]KKR83714.1 MAG: hypothetical protein UU29_C0002G0027 [Candidatus Daviesbacteria bacterium GW2011_GWA2_40_9]KKR93691.1 MAG: hypothetical protein UU44_C0001G0031 [Candidatus Daviesbacteria bacterium GW2011_GWB1_41_15]KKS15157.1 MAG: hypothetical protein UU73_C0002G0031 [Candidatus Daviesbacteria bacterium GW2011_GWA1_41_61]